MNEIDIEVSLSSMTYTSVYMASIGFLTVFYSVAVVVRDNEEFPNAIALYANLAQGKTYHIYGTFYL